MKEKEEIILYHIRKTIKKFSGVAGKSIKKVKSWAFPHQAKRECERRLRQFP